MFSKRRLFCIHVHRLSGSVRKDVLWLYVDVQCERRATVQVVAGQIKILLLMHLVVLALMEQNCLLEGRRWRSCLQGQSVVSAHLSPLSLLARTAGQLGVARSQGQHAFIVITRCGVTGRIIYYSL